MSFAILVSYGGRPLVSLFHHQDIMQAVEIEDLLASFTTNGRTEQSGPDRRPTGGSFGREPSVAGQPESSPLFTPPLPPPTADFEV